MRLKDLHPQLLGDGVFLEFDCPLGHPHRIVVPIDASRHAHSWTPTGEFPASLTLQPSIWAHTAHPTDNDLLGEAHQKASVCGWHGFITDGEIKHA